MKQIGKKHKWLVCLLAIVVLIGVIAPLGILQAQNVVETGALALTDAYAKGTSNYSYACLEFKATTPMNLETGKLTADGGDVLCNGTSIAGKYGIRVDNKEGIFVIDGIALPKATDTITVQGQFKYTDSNKTAKIEFPTTTFQYMGLNGNNKGYWRDYTATVESGALTLANESLDGSNQYGWGGFRFTTTSGYVPAPRGINTQKFQSDGGTITLKADQNAEEVNLQLGTDINLKAGDSSTDRRYYVEDYKGGAFASGNIIIIQGKFKTADGFSINIAKTAFKYEVEGTSYKWSYYTEVRDSGEVALEQNGKITSEAAVYFWPGNKDNVTFSSDIQLAPVSGSGKILANGTDVSSSAGLFSYTNGSNAIWGISTAVGTEITLEGDFSPVNDATIVIRYPQTVFKVIEAGAGSRKWVQVRTSHYVDSGAIAVHANSATGNTPKADLIYFQTENTTLSQNIADAGWLRPEQGTILYNGSDITSSLKYSGNARIYSHANGVYLMYLQRNAVDGTKVALQGSFAMADGTIGINFKQIVFEYVVPQGKETGYWIIEGTQQEPPQEDTRANVALAAEIKTTHPNAWGENNGFGIVNMIDGKATSGNWGITQESKDDQNTKMSVILTFDKTYKVDEACLYAVANGGFPENFVLEAYTQDGWKTVVTKNAYVATDTGKQSFVFDAVDCRMFRLTTTKNGLTSGEKYGIFLQEFEVYGKASDLVIAPEVKEEEKTLPNIAAATNGSTISTTHPDAWGEKNGFGIANMIDGKGGSGNYGITAATEDYKNTKMSISVNFKKAYKVNKICLYATTDGGFPEDFTLAAYTKSGWKTVVTKKGYKAEAGCQTFEIAPIDCSAIKLISTKNGVTHQGKYGIYLREFEVYGEESSVSIPKAPTLGAEAAGGASTSFTYNADKNIALNMPATCHSDYAQYGFGIDNINDGNLNSPWSCNMLLVEKDKPEWIEINLLGNYKINTVALYARANGWGFPKDIKISVFYDDNWIEVVNVKNYKASTSVKSTAEYVFKFKETIGNKIRIEGSNFNIADGEYGMQLTEIAAYGDLAIGDYILPLNNYVSAATGVTTSSTLEDFGFFTLYLSDGDVKTGYSSNQHTSSKNVEWIELDLKRVLSVGSILLRPAVGGSGFPVDFEIQAMQDGKWKTVYKVTDYKKPVDEAWQQFVLDKQFRTDKIRIYATKLGDDFGQYSLRMNEIEIYPSEVKDKDMEAVEVGNKEYATYNAAQAVETKRMIPTTLIISGAVIAGTALVGIIVVYILTLRKMKRKEK